MGVYLTIAILIMGTIWKTHDLMIKHQIWGVTHHGTLFSDKLM